MSEEQKAAFTGARRPALAEWPARSERRSLRREVFLAAAGLILISGLLAAMALSYLRQRTIETGERLAQTFALVIQEQTARTLEAVNQRLTITGERLAHLQASGGLNEASGQALLLREVNASPTVTAIRVLDSNGRVVMASDPESLSQDLSQRDYFTIQLAESRAGFFVGIPESPSLRGEGALNASTSFRLGDGAPWVLVATLRRGNFEQSWNQISLGEGGAIVLLRGDGVMLARSPFDEAKIGQSFAEGPVFRASRGRTEGTLRDAEMEDSVSRVLTYRTVEALPGSVVVVGQAYDVMLSPWRQTARIAFALWIGGALSILALCHLLLLAWQRGIRSDTEAQRMAERLSLATDAAQVGIWDWSPATGDWYATPTYFAMMGMDPNHAPAHDREWADFFHQDDRERVKAAVDEVRRGEKKAFRYEGRVRHQDGSYRWVSGVGRLVERDPGGGVRRMLGARIDITDLKQAEENLREARDLLRSVIQHVPAGVFWKDRTSRYLGCNQRFAEHAERADPGDMVGLDDFEMPWKASANPYREHDRTVMESGAPLLDFEHSGVASDGRAILLSTSKVALRNERGEVVGLLGIQRDVTEARAAQDAIEESEERYRTLMQWLPHGVTVHREGKLLYVNPALSRMLGATSVEDLLGRDILDFVRADFHPLALSRRKAVEEQGGSAPPVEMTFLRLDGSEFEVEIHGIGIVFDGSPAIFTSLLDISDRKAADQALRDSLHEKEALLKEVHHRVKNNLQVITSLLRLEAGRSAHADTKAALRSMQARIHAMALLHETLYRSGTFASVDLGVYLKQLAGQSFRAQSAQTAPIHLELDLASARVEMDQAIPCGLLVNELISNSLKHGFPDGGTGEIRVELSMEGGGSHVRVRVSDTGVGLPADFESRREVTLGLQLSTDLARQLGGKLEVGPAPGSIFTVTFPAQDAAPSPKARSG